MKQTLKIFTLLAAMLTLAGCDPDEMFNTERDITYSVSEKTNYSEHPEKTETTTVHLKTEAEWQALLDRFCDWAEGGSTVTFHRVGTQRAAFASGKGIARTGHALSLQAKDAVEYSTTSREEMKRWMALMEDEGKTVTVSYDPATGTWNGTAYANAPQPPLPSGGLITYECDGMNDFGYIWSFDTVNRRVYITIHYTLQNITAPDYPVGVYEYRLADEVNTPFAYWLIDSWGDTAGLYYLESIGDDTLHFNSTHISNPATLVRTDNWQTYLSVDDISGAAIVMHINTDVIETNPTQFIGQANSNYDNGQAYGPGRFIMVRTSTIDYDGTLLYFLNFDFTSFGNDEVYGNSLIQNEPIVDDHFIIYHGLYHNRQAPNGLGFTSQDIFWRL